MVISRAPHWCFHIRGNDTDASLAAPVLAVRTAAGEMRLIATENIRSLASACQIHEITQDTGSAVGPVTAGHSMDPLGQSGPSKAQLTGAETNP